MEEHSSLSSGALGILSGLGLGLGLGLGSGALGILSVCLGCMSVYVRPFARFLFSVVEEPTRLG